MKKDVDSHFHVFFNKASNGNLDAREEYVFMQLLQFPTFVYYSYNLSSSHIKPNTCSLTGWPSGEASVTQLMKNTALR